ncbi:FHA domain-containing protein [Bacteroides sp. GD17]|jgi:cell division protein FtsB|uniref:FHA domain-containing protein n=1 Tax=Bacteroides sp. GD17 TaxID=3139826 RepID=UPI0025CCB6BD|nr:FHA domain-containing protein [uncultured Bacteroides sp.]
MDTQNYKRTLAGSVGAGMGALMGASGRTYFILEHKASSKYHQAGESQKIIVDQVELGRDASCQVRFDESFETVSRKHAAIVRDGENWKLIHLSQSNPTLVNGHPINGSYYLQTGDEIQLSVGGPRLGFIVPQGRQALTSSIGLTERMSLFRKQALRPYKTALTVMGIVFVLAIAGLAAWNYSLGVKNELLAEKTEQQELQLRGYQNQLDSLGTERASLEAQQRDLEAKLRNSDGNTEALKTQLANVNGQLSHVNASFYKVKSDLDNLSSSMIAAREEASDIRPQNTAPQAKPQYDEEPAITAKEDENASGDLKDYYDHIYTIKVDRIEIEYNGAKFDPGIQVSDIICGTGFMLSDGTFVTDRQNIEPWIYSNTEWKDSWRKLLAVYKGGGCNIIIHYRAYSTKGTGRPLTFTNGDFATNRMNDMQLTEIEVDKSIRVQLREHGIKVKYERRKYINVSIVTPTAYSWAYIRGKGIHGEGLPYDIAAADNMSGGTEVQMVGYAGYADIHNLTPAHFNDHTNIADTKYRTIILQNRVAEHGYYGSPAFLLEDDGYKVIGFMVGSIEGKDRLVPIGNLKN